MAEQLLEDAQWAVPYHRQVILTSQRPDAGSSFPQLVVPIV